MKDHKRLLSRLFGLVAVFVFCGMLGTSPLLAKETINADSSIGSLITTKDTEMSIQGATVTVSGNAIVSGGDLYLEDGTNGVAGKLVVNGDLYLTDGNLRIKNGSVIVKGNLYVTGENKESEGSGKLWMDQEGSYLSVAKGMYFNTSKPAYLFRGKIDLGGDLQVKKPSNGGETFVAKSLQVELLNPATVTFEMPGCRFNELILDQEYKQYSFNVKECWKVLTMKKVNLQDCDITLEKTKFAFTGKAIVPEVKSVTLKQDGIAVPASAYTVTATNNVRPGKATLKFAAVAPGYNEQTLTFTIVYDRAVLTSVRKFTKNSIRVTWKKSEVADGYEVNWGLKKTFKGAKKKNVKKDNYSLVVKRLKKNKKYFVRVRAYKKVSGKKVYTKWSKIKSVRVV